MSKFFDDTMQGLLQAIEIENENIPLTERNGMPAPTFYVSSDDKELVDRLIEIRKKENISQSELAKMTGNTQQAISRLEKKNHSPSLQTFCSILDALGYGLVIEKKAAI
ncbi:MAG: helix-turn-helix transcriptional regulator [Eubacterium sp.]|jgi:DNA-binding XRE family transcriptional regulator|nr:helix-turn-helix transcriptional regulator [Eubacterium sp.]